MSSQKNPVKIPSRKMKAKGISGALVFVYWMLKKGVWPWLWSQVFRDLMEIYHQHMKREIHRMRLEGKIRRDENGNLSVVED